jgi:hemerythrin-like metal-binding protein
MEAQDLITWDDRLLTNISIIDQQHQHFVKILNLLYHKFEHLAPKEEIDPLISELVSYATTHFATEEGYMEKYNYPELAEHKEIHEKMSADLTKYVDGYNKEGKKVLPDLFDFLEDWLVQHLDIYDHKYAEFFAEIGVSE